VVKMTGPERKHDLAADIERRLSFVLGPHTARVAMKAFCQKALGRGPETLTPADIPKLNDALRPLLRTFVGRAQTEVILERFLVLRGA
jgi:hypothetical protein